jgi:hypothetical protein
MQGTEMKLRAVFPDPWLLTPAPSPVHLFLSHRADEFNNYFRPLVFPAARAIGPETICPVAERSARDDTIRTVRLRPRDSRQIAAEGTERATKRHEKARKGEPPRTPRTPMFLVAEAADGRGSEGNLGLTAGRCVVPRRGWSR